MCMCVLFFLAELAQNFMLNSTEYELLTAHKN